MSSFTDKIDLAQERLGGRALEASDEFFAPKENLLKPGRGVFIADKYTENGKWMDGWESRRKRTPGHDWCIIRLGMPGVIRGVDIDTNHFTGNFPEHASIDACDLPLDASTADLSNANWTEILPRKRLDGGSQNLFPIESDRRWTHVCLNIFPDGGVARLRVYGDVQPDWDKIRAQKGLIDLAGVQNGGAVVTCNDMFFGPKDNLILPGESTHMGDGWETKRKRAPGHDWVVVKLGAPGIIKKIEVDTAHFKGNYPDRCSIDAAKIGGDVPNDFLVSRSLEWEEILPSVKLEANQKHVFEKEIKEGGPYTHARLNIYPDGGIARLRLFGSLA